MVCKWTYEILPDKSMQWNKSYFSQIGLDDLLVENKIGDVVKSPGDTVGNGLSVDIARELGLQVGTPVGASIIDAHSGGLGLIGCQVEGVAADFSSRLSKYCQIDLSTTIN